MNQDIGNTQDIRLGLLLWFRLARFYNGSNRVSNQHLKKWGLSISQFDLLVQVGVHQPLSQQELAEKLLVSKGNITQMLVKLEKAGLIKRKQEWRIKQISLTAAGQKLYEEVVPEQERFQASQFKGLDRREQKQLLGLLKKLQINSKEE
ncbi:MarR family winged helix-turn-helix transcriptional regulator [Halalkalibacter alkalisediminis]|uniref:MarR family winged helix-turn-helix transcriptional regulator n=1 Tax=Halalkalibacter alkalisediminis TaxID=935616 RepID=A0ABV6NHY5_9BACI|nr:MarR family transcriptional regulator [Halalkalibacter alkalisediminis]